MCPTKLYWFQKDMNQKQRGLIPTLLEGPKYQNWRINKFQIWLFPFWHGDENT